MDNDAPEQVGPGGKPEWFLGWLREVFLPATKNPLAEQIEQFENAVGQLWVDFSSGLHGSGLHGLIPG